MGNYHIAIEGTGQHHNNGDPKDADVLAAKFAQELKDAGHNVESATITHGGRNDVMPK